MKKVLRQIKTIADLELWYMFRVLFLYVFGLAAFIFMFVGIIVLSSKVV